MIEHHVRVIGQGQWFVNTQAGWMNPFPLDQVDFLLMIAVISYIAAAEIRVRPGLPAIELSTTKVIVHVSQLSVKNRIAWE
jgi:hypothetical protein